MSLKNSSDRFKITVLLVACLAVLSYIFDIDADFLLAILAALVVILLVVYCVLWVIVKYLERRDERNSLY